MIAGARAASGPRLASAPLAREAVDRLARWLLVAVALDLILTRLVVRLAIFVPKGEPWGTVGAALGRIGAATDALVPIVGMLLLGALLLRAGRSGRRGDQAILVAIAAVAAGGLALIALPPTPPVAMILDLLVVVVALVAGVRIRGDAGTPWVAAMGLAALGGAIAVAGVGRMVDVAGAMGGPVAGWPGAGTGLTMGAVGQIGFVAGGALVGLGGIIGVRTPGPARRRFAALGLGAGLMVIVAEIAAPATWGALAVWSVGLAGAVPVAAVALAVGLAVAGLPALHRRAPATALGASIVLLSGYGLAASGLVLAGLLGLVVARSHESAVPEAGGP